MKTDYDVRRIADKLEVAVIRSGWFAMQAPRDASIKSGEGHRAIITAGDSGSQNTIVSAFDAKEYPELKFLCEEDSNDPRVLPHEDPAGLCNGLAIVADPLDGTALYADFYPEWTVGAGIMENGRIVASVVSAPQSNGGMKLTSFKDDGVFLADNARYQRIVAAGARYKKDSIVLRGADTELYPNLMALMPQVAAEVRGVYITGSALFGLMQVTLGRAAAIIQTPQKAWDWVPAYHAAIYAGKVFFFFRIVDGALVHIPHYDAEAFKSAPECRLGFVAGEERMADELVSRLPETGWKRTRPPSQQM